MIKPKNKFNPRIFKDYSFNGFILLISCLCAVPLILILYFIIQKGISSISWQFLVNTPKPVGETGSGIVNAIIGSLIIVSLAAIIAIPVAVIAGVYIAENRNTRIARLASFSAEILQGVPSIIIGIIAYIWVVKPSGHFSAISGSIALAIMMLPVIIRTTEETVSLIPGTIKEASLALGVPYYKTMLRIVIPSGFSGIISGIILSVARVAGETAPLLFTAFDNQFISLNPSKPIATLPYSIFYYATSPYPEWKAKAWGAAFVLLTWILLISLLSKFLTRRWKIQF
jgi:phosphate transport system permease protein